MAIINKGKIKDDFKYHYAMNKEKILEQHKKQKCY